jgi:DNA-binding MurR/RpiR family transcriptional regulator
MSATTEPAAPRLLSNIEQAQKSFSPNDRRIAEYLLVAYPQTAWGTVEEVARGAGVSKSAIVRFASRLGYDGFQQLQRELQDDFSELLTSPARLVEQRTRADAHVVTNGLELAVANLRSTFERLNASQQLDHVARRIIACRGRIVILGMRKSFGLAAYLEYLLAAARAGVELVRPDSASFPGGLADLTPDDVLIAISVRRYTRAALQAMEYARGAGVHVVAITDTVAGPAAARADVVLTATSDGVLLYDSAISIVFIAEAIANSIVSLDYEHALARLERSEAVGQQFSLFERPSTLPTANTPQPRSGRRTRAPRAPAA